MSAAEACEAYVQDWAPSYVRHTQLVRETGGVSTFRTTWSRPTAEHPISDIIATVEVMVDLNGASPAVSHRLDTGFTHFSARLAQQEKQIEWLLDDKRAVRDTLARLESADRLPKPQARTPEAGR